MKILNQEQKEYLVKIGIIFLLMMIELAVAFVVVKGFNLPDETLILLGSISIFLGKEIKKRISE